MNKLPKSRNENILVQNLDNEILIYDLITNKAFCLNETSSKIYQHCDGKTSFDDLRRKYNFTDDIIFLALDGLKLETLLDDNSKYISPFADLSRREVIRKVGLGTMIALPIVSSIVAPSAVMAASICLTSGTARGNTTTCCGITCDPAFDAARDAACNTTYGAACCAGAEEIPGTCGPFNAGTGAVFSCRCI